jgi:uncharacterized protein (TIGR00369 family)
VTAGGVNREVTAESSGRDVSDYFRFERRELPSSDGTDGFPEFEGRAAVDSHQLSAAGGIRIGGLLTSLDDLGGLLSGISVQPNWVVTTSMMATVARVAHQGPLRMHGRVLRRGRNSVVAGLDVVDEGDHDQPVAAVTMTFAILDPGAIEFHIERPIATPMPSPRIDPKGLEEFFRIEPGTGPVTRLDLAAHLRNPWGILHGGAVATLADVAACRAVEGASPGARRAASAVAGDFILHFLRPVRVGPVEARCQVLGGSGGRSVVRVAIHDLGADDRMVDLAMVTVFEA